MHTISHLHLLSSYIIRVGFFFALPHFISSLPFGSISARHLLAYNFHYTIFFARFIRFILYVHVQLKCCKS